MVEYKKTLEEVKEYLEEHLADYSIEQYGTDMIVSDKGIEYENKELPKGFILSDHLVLDEVTFKPYLHEIIDDIVFFEDLGPERFEVVKKPVTLTAELVTQEKSIAVLDGYKRVKAGEYIITEESGDWLVVDKDTLEKEYDIL